MRRGILLLMGVMAFLGLNAQNVTITGRCNRPETLVRLMACDDLLNGHETPVAETRSDSQGFFILEGTVEETLPAALYVGLESVDFVVCPNASYELSVTVPDPDPSLSYFERPLPVMRVKTATDKGVYRQMVISGIIIDDYVLNCFDQLYRRHQYAYLDSIRNAIDAELDITDPFVLQQNTYKIASVQMAVNADGGQRVIQEYYDGKPVLYRCPAYMDLFKDLFRNTEMSKEFRTRNPELSELVDLYQLRDLYNSEFQSRQWVRAQLKGINTHTKSKETKAMVANMLERFDRFAEGAPAPDFTLQSADGSSVALSDFKDELVLLHFVDAPSRTAEHQFQTLAYLHDQWQDSVQLVTVATKDQFSFYQKRFEEQHYDWPLLNLGNEILLLEQYEVRTFPEYVLLLPDTKIGRAPAPNPDGNLEKVVRSLYAQYKGLRRK